MTRYRIIKEYDGNKVWYRVKWKTGRWQIFWTERHYYAGPMSSAPARWASQKEAEEFIASHKTERHGSEVIYDKVE